LALTDEHLSYTVVPPLPFDEQVSDVPIVERVNNTPDDAILFFFFPRASCGVDPMLNGDPYMRGHQPFVSELRRILA
jgi:hypothetical protein